MFKSANDLTDTARARLVTFCADNLKAGLDAHRYADGLIQEADLTSCATLEIRSFDTKSGNPATISFNEKELAWEEHEEN